ncbi:MAG: 3-phytase [Aeromicrobium sp.]|nr:3-phytase [Aeromicrobium sp.]
MTTNPLRAGAIGVAALTALAIAAPALASNSPSAPTTSFSMKLYRTSVKPLGTVGGTTVTGDGFGSALAPVPHTPNQFYGLTDRGPNVDGPSGTKIEPFPSFDPSIGRFRLDSNGKATLLQTIPLKAKDGSPYNGQVSTLADTGETITKLDGSVLPKSPNGFDSEGLVALNDGTFWISDEYGPFIRHFDHSGRAIGGFSPYDGTLPAELKRRTPNKGMEGLTITPDGKTLVGIMQAALTQPDADKSSKVAVTRIVTVDIKTGKTHEYAYALDNPAVTGAAVSEISALSATQFVVDERDGNFEPGAYKKLWKIDISSATDIGPYSAVGTYSAESGVLIGGKSLEAIAGTGTQASATAALATAGVTTVTKSVYLDLGALVTGAAADGSFFGHDKVEGLAVLDGGKKIVISNDSDFGIDASTGAAPPFGVHTKTLPDGRQDFGEFLVISRQ